MRPGGDVILHAQAGVRAGVRPALQPRGPDDGELPDFYFVSQFRILDDGARADAAVLPNGGVAKDLRKRLHNGVHADGDIRVHSDRLRFLDGHAGQHEFAHLALAQQTVHTGQFFAVVDAQHLARIVDAISGDGVPGPVQDLDHVGQVVFARGIIRPEFLNVPPKRRRLIAVQAHVGLPDGELFRRAGALLHHACDLAVAVAQHASVAGGIVHHGG